MSASLMRERIARNSNYFAIEEEQSFRKVFATIVAGVAYILIEAWIIVEHASYDIVRTRRQLEDSQHHQR